MKMESVPILLVPYGQSDGIYFYKNANNVSWPPLQTGLLALDAAAARNGLLFCDLRLGANVWAINGTGIVVDTNIRPSWLKWAIHEVRIGNNLYGDNALAALLDQ